MYRVSVIRAIFAFLSWTILASGPADQQTVIVVVGAPGNDEYGTTFTASADRWEEAAKNANAQFVRIGDDTSTVDDAPTDRDKLKQAIDSLPANSKPVWIVLIGHGTFDGREAKFNLRGPDVSAAELSEWLKPLTMPLAIINCASSSGPFINQLSAENRVVVTATRSGYEYNYARFGEYLSKSISDEAADLDKDGQTSLLEAFLAASAGVTEFYDGQARLATEHALLDDNGDAMGTPADWFRGFRAVRGAKDGALPDGSRANQFILLPRGQEADMPAEFRDRRDQLELRIETLRQLKSELAEDEYYRRLEPLLIELAELYRDLDFAAPR